MHDVQVEIDLTPVRQRLQARFFYAFFFVEGVLDLGNDEELFTVHQAIFYCSRNALACFHFISAVWNQVSLASSN
jgi:hypothetical protein